ncbi:S-adenosylmethionine:tRNA ribosyltransferase-isomerase [Algoriphagus ratkowskyi]|uniref:S-adenosylmethionine:tRNA ribosyltransferase-isomerase n=1 Tax=Algoriphagus ratkowskyi TaxID=57028 RepID=A0A2W7R9P8_9BACT|nr:S-adenosylmethionine:tRNA ribosyltransferase-isomerase [Algoriphagus ratkowskyi]PZX57633.1 S-adenosylmethionine:tRNA ribosyltransferase-isomerase [Algoriphagus ratkowskyi]TXD78904.1 S-adenosylmethionine:tRNA ribosyltransferase-isomerase [Algoriphagus ratkowskyi]
MQIPSIDLKAYEYTLPEEKIAKFPLAKRDSSKLLQYKDGQISHFNFSDISELLPAETLLVYNDTKVIPARLIFQRETGARIEIFLLQPISPTTVIPEIMLAKHPVIWETMIGNAKKWKDGEVLKGIIPLENRTIVLLAKLIDRESRKVEFSWDDDEVAFVDVVEASGEVPLPPYLNRKPNEEDKIRYQTVYSEKEGAVAAPTAGLHFTPEIFELIRSKGIKEAQVTLHVSAGTFQPIKASEVTEHPMHSEQIHVNRNTIRHILSHLGNVVTVGTTSVRTLESLYWYGVKLLEEKGEDLTIEKLFPYLDRKSLPTAKESYDAILSYMDEKGIDTIMGTTEIFIFPGYKFKIVNGLITNFHQPGSTLILLIATILGEDWKRVYAEAMANEYRFLSYGDSSLLWIK